MPDPDSQPVDSTEANASTSDATRAGAAAPAGDAPTSADVGAPAPTPAAETTQQTQELFTIARNLGSAGVFGLLTIFVPPIGLALMATFMGKIQPFIESLGVWGPVGFAVIMILMAGFSLMPTQVYSVFAGLLIGKAFGLPIGALTAVGGAVGAAMLMYAWVSLVAKDKVMRQIETHRKARIIHHALVDRGFWEALGIVTLLRFPPNMPFALSGFVMASMKVNFAAYTLGTLLGMAPRLTLCVWIGMTIGSFEEARKNPYSFWFMVTTVVVAIVIVLIFSRMAKRALEKYDVEPAATDRIA